MEADPLASLHSDTQTCKTERFEWLDFNRFSTNECLSFGVKTDGDVDVAIVEVPDVPGVARPESGQVTMIRMKSLMVL